MSYAIRVHEPQMRCSAGGNTIRNAADFECESSFSEVQNMRATLANLADQFVADAYLAKRARLKRSPTGAAQERSSSRVLPAYIQSLEDGIVEFQGTDQELRITEKLLLALQRAKIYDRWLDIYLATLYQHPTEPAIGRLAYTAARTANSLGQQTAVRHGFSLVMSIPRQCEAETQVEMAAHELTEESSSTEPLAAN